MKAVSLSVCLPEGRRYSVSPLSLSGSAVNWFRPAELLTKHQAGKTNLRHSSQWACLYEGLYWRGCICSRRPQTVGQDLSWGYHICKLGTQEIIDLLCYYSNSCINKQSAKWVVQVNYYSSLEHYNDGRSTIISVGRWYHRQMVGG